MESETGTRRAALVTGAASGIGRAIATAFEGAGYDVLAIDLTPVDDGPGTPFAADLYHREANRAAVAAAVERFGRLDVVVASAGVQHVAPIADFPEDMWDRLIALLLTSPSPPPCWARRSCSWTTSKALVCTWSTPRGSAGRSVRLETNHQLACAWARRCCSWATAPARVRSSRRRSSSRTSRPSPSICCSSS